MREDRGGSDTGLKDGDRVLDMRTLVTISARWRIAFFLVLAFAGPGVAQDGKEAPAAKAGLRLPAIFSDHMVLQRDMAVAVWGWAAAGEEVTVSAGGQSVNAKAGADGKWRVSLKPMAAAESTELVVKGKEKTITVKDVAVGEVWLASGQSNMRIPMSRNPEDFKKVEATAEDAGLRVFAPKERVAYVLQEDAIGVWVPSTTKSVKSYDFSAVGYTFARELRRTQKVPVGIIVAAVGGVPGVTYISPEGLEASDDPGLKACAAKYRRESAIVTKWLAEEAPAAMAKYLEEKALAIKNKTALPKGPVPPVVLPWSSGKTSMLYHGQLGPIQPYAMRGALWYQGENADGPTDYRKLLDALMVDWRKGFENPDLALLVVQITAQKPAFREKQLRFCQQTPKTGLAVINDTCTADEYVHPRYKETTGRRLSLLARGIVYGEKIVYSGPVYQAVKFEGQKAILSFTHVGEGLAAKVPVDPTKRVLTEADLGGDLGAKGGELRGFVIAGEDQKFVPAKAEIVGDTVVVSSEQVSKPAAVRYLWCEWPALWTDTTLYNKNGLPAPPFRTDDWRR